VYYNITIRAIIMALRAGRRLLNQVHTIKTFEQYEKLRNETSTVFVGWYTSQFSAASKIYTSKFEEMAKSYPQYTFFQCDIDDAPRAAYDAEINDVPMISVQPVGITPAGIWYDKTDLQTVRADEDMRYDQIIARAKEIIDGIKFGESTNLPQPEWRFDPTTGTTARV